MSKKKYIKIAQYVGEDGKIILDLAKFKKDNPTGIFFDSIDEFYAYRIIKESGFVYTLKPSSRELIPYAYKVDRFSSKTKKIYAATVQDTVYTPDFLIEYAGLRIFIEYKGFLREKDRIIHKLFINSLSENEKFFIVHSNAELIELLQQIRSRYAKLKTVKI